MRTVTDLIFYFIFNLRISLHIVSASELCQSVLVKELSYCVTSSSTPSQISIALKYCMNYIPSHHRFQPHCCVLEFHYCAPLALKFMSCFSFIVHLALYSFTPSRKNSFIVRIRIRSSCFPEEAQGFPV